MMANTHLIIAKNIYYDLDYNSKKILSYNNFLYGNVKPDMVSKYKLKKHYMDESFNMILDKIKILSALSYNELNKISATVRFSQELGVICHFLCDFFCIPHSKRWEFKHSLNKHVKYEKELSVIGKNFKFSNSKTKVFGFYNIKEFIKSNHKLYIKNMSYENDLMFANYICLSIVQYIFDSIEFNSSLDLNILYGKYY